MGVRKRKLISKVVSRDILLMLIFSPRLNFGQLEITESELKNFWQDADVRRRCRELVAERRARNPLSCPRGIWAEKNFGKFD